MRDLPIVQRIREEIVASIVSHTSRDVILDLSEVSFVGSVAFLAFLAIRRQPSVEKIIMSSMQENVRDVFLLCKLIPDGSLSIAPFDEAPTTEAAIAMINQA